MDETVFAPGQSLPLHAHARPVLLMFLEGTATHALDAASRQMTAGDVAFVPSRTAHAFTFALGIGRAFSVEFEQCSTALQRVELPSHPIHTSDPHLLAAMLRAYRGFATDNQESGESVARSLVEALVDVDNRRSALRSHDPGSWLAEAFARLHDSPVDGLRMATIARQVGINPCHMSRRFRQVFGESMSSVRERVRVEHASRALLSEMKTISTIALEHGFCDHAHLTRSFRRAMRMTPSELRRVIGETSLPDDLRRNLHAPGAFMFRSSSSAGIRLV
jgi:AraC-like DNA-binding protein